MPVKLIDAVTPGLAAARQLWMQGKFDQALQAFDRCAAKEPHNVRAAIDAARAYFARYEFDRGESILSALRRRAPNHPGVHHLAGDTYALLKMLPQAQQCYEQGSRLSGALPVTWVELASLYERTHRVDEARNLVQRALAADRSFPLAILIHCRLERRDGRLTEAESELCDLVKRLPPKSDIAARVWAEVAQVRDKLGDYDGAFHATEKWKSIHRGRESNDLRESRRIVGSYQQLAEQISRETMVRWQSDESDSVKTALLTGFPRSGTTLLEQVLDAHPEIVSSEERDFLAREQFPSWQRRASPNTTLLDVLEQQSPVQLGKERGPLLPGDGVVSG